MNRLGRAVLNSPARAAAQRRYVVPALGRLGGDLDGCRVLEIGCGRGFGSTLILDLLGAASVEALDIDPAMVRLASRRLGERGRVRVGDMVDTGAASNAYDAVVDMGAIHLEPRWREAIGEIGRVLRPGGRFYFEEIVQPRRQAFSALATGRRLPIDFARQSLLGQLEAVGFVQVGLKDVGPMALTGVVGDVIGVARIDRP